MYHKDLTINHILESFVYANAAARIGASGFAASDAGRIAFQTDTGQYFRLKTVTPVVWVLIGPATPQGVTYAWKQTGLLTPSGTSNGANPGVMMGMGVGNTITPVATGKLLFTICGTLLNAHANHYTYAQMRVGSGTPPANGVAAAGLGVVVGTTVMLANNAGDASGFSLSYLNPGGSVGTAYWFDLALWEQIVIGGAPDAGNAACSASLTAAELP